MNSLDKTTIIVFSMILIITSVFAIPETLNTQGRLNFANGSTPNGNFDFSFKIYDGKTAGNLLWEENQTITLANGTYDAILGEITPLSNLTFEIQKYLGIQVGNDEEMGPRINFTSVPYSFISKLAQNLSCINCVNNSMILDRTLSSDDLADASINLTHLVSTLDVTNYTAGTGISILNHVITSAINGMDYASLALTNETEDFSSNLTIEDSLLVDYIFNLNGTTINLQNITILDDLRVLGNSYLGSFTIEDDLIIGSNNFSSTNVGIGTTNPSEELEVNGDFNLNGTLNMSINTVFVIGELNDTSVGGSAEDMGTPEGIDVIGGYAYVATNSDNTLTIIDISNPRNPQQIGSYGTISGAYDVQVVGNYAYVTSMNGNSLNIIDVSNPAAPGQIGIIQNESNGGTASGLASPQGVYIQGKYAYVASATSDSLTIIDISDPTNPTETGFIQDENQGGTATGLDDAYDVYVQGESAYVVSRNNDSLSIFNVSDPTTPTEISVLRDSESGGTASALDRPEYVYISEGYAYISASNDGAMGIVNISDPANPVEVGAIQSNLFLGGIDRVRVSGKYAYAAAPNVDALSIIDVSDPTTPFLVGFIKDTEQGATGTAEILDGISDVFIKGKYAYVTATSDSGLSIIDLGGIDSHAANIGDLSVRTIEVSDNLIVGSNAYIKYGLNIGSGGIKSDGPVSFKGKSLVVAPGDNVGIGTTSPTHVLNVVGDANITTNLTVEDSIITDYIYPFNNPSTKINNVTITNDLRVLGNSYLGSFKIEDDLIIGSNNFSSTFVGIGTTIPTTTLDVYGGDVNISESGSEGFFFDTTNERLGISDPTPSYLLDIDSAGGTAFAVEHTSTASQGNKIAIGIASAPTRADLIESEVVDPNGASYDSLLRLKVYENNNYASPITFYGSKVAINGELNVSEELIIRNNNFSSTNVGIGTTTPSQALDVNGNVTVEENINNSHGNSTFNSIYQNPYSTDESLVLYLPMSEESHESTNKTMYDRSPYGNDGHSLGATCNSTSGRYGRGCYFGGDDDHINVSYDESLNDFEEITIMAWFKNERSGANVDIVNKYTFFSSGYDWVLRTDTNDKPAFLSSRVSAPTNSFSVVSPEPLVQNKWYHLVATYDKANMRIYVNGELKAVTAQTEGFNNYEIPIQIGKGPTNFDEDVKGFIDEVRIYNISISQDEIRTHYLQGLKSHGVIEANRFRIINTSSDVIFEMNNSGLVIGSDNAKFIIDTENRKVGIGTTTPTHTLNVEGDTNITGDLLVQGQNMTVPDYVFEAYYNNWNINNKEKFASYQVQTLKELKDYTRMHNKLPPSPIQGPFVLDKESNNIIKQQYYLLEKTEETFIHLIEIQDQLDKLKEENKKLRKEINSIKNK